jgi:excisionase family DNA binding protein
MPSRGKKKIPNSCGIEETGVSARLLKKYELAQFLGKGRRSVELMMLNRQIPFIKIGRHVRFRLSDVEAALEKFVVKEVA